MPVRSIIRIDESKCNGCGNCIIGCAEGALALVNGKAKLVRESYCDGLGACLGECPTGALTIERREAEEFCEETSNIHAGHAAALLVNHGSPGCSGGGCPGSAPRVFEAGNSGPCDATRMNGGENGHSGPRPGALTHWPVQLHLISPGAPQYQAADVLIAADCTAFSFGAFHETLLKEHALIIACPKLDDTKEYAEKLAALFVQAKPRSITIARMEAPCCSGLTRLVRQARAMAESDIPVTEVILSVEGKILAEAAC